MLLLQLASPSQRFHFTGNYKYWVTETWFWDPDPALLKSLDSDPDSSDVNRIGFSLEPDPDFYLNMNPDPHPGSLTIADPHPAQTLKSFSHKLQVIGQKHNYKPF